MPEITVFLSYRRADTSADTGRLYDALKRRFGKENLFMDVDSLRPGQDWVEAVEVEVARCDVLLALIGRDWVTVKDADGRPRLHGEMDRVRLEIETALRQGKPVIPVLFGEATMPREGDLPESLKPLLRRHAIRISHASFAVDLGALVRALKIIENAKQPSPQEKDDRLAAGAAGAGAAGVAAAGAGAAGAGAAAAGTAATGEIAPPPPPPGADAIAPPPPTPVAAGIVAPAPPPSPGYPTVAPGTYAPSPPPGTYAPAPPPPGAGAAAPPPPPPTTMYSAAPPGAYAPPSAPPPATAWGSAPSSSRSIVPIAVGGGIVLLLLGLAGAFLLGGPPGPTATPFAPLPSPTEQPTLAPVVPTQAPATPLPTATLPATTPALTAAPTFPPGVAELMALIPADLVASADCEPELDWPVPKVYCYLNGVSIWYEVYEGQQATDEYDSWLLYHDVSREQANCFEDPPPCEGPYKYNDIDPAGRVMAISDEEDDHWLYWTYEPAGLFGHMLTTTLEYEDVFNTWQDRASLVDSEP